MNHHFVIGIALTVLFIIKKLTDLSYNETVRIIGFCVLSLGAVGAIVDVTGTILGYW